VLGKDGHVVGLKLARTEKGEDGRLTVIPGSEFELPFDMVIKALGQEKMTDMLKGLFPDLELARNGVIQREPDTGQTNIPHVFTGGDGANGGSEVVNAVGEGKKAARAIHRLFTDETVEGPVQWTRIGVVNAKPVGAGLDQPIRVPELKSTYSAGGK